MVLWLEEALVLDMVPTIIFILESIYVFGVNLVFGSSLVSGFVMSQDQFH